MTRSHWEVSEEAEVTFTLEVIITLPEKTKPQWKEKRQRGEKKRSHRWSRGHKRAKTKQNDICRTRHQQKGNIIIREHICRCPVIIYNTSREVITFLCELRTAILKSGVVSCIFGSGNKSKAILKRHFLYLSRFCSLGFGLKLKNPSEDILLFFLK